jgi:hypothetical protein
VLNAPRGGSTDDSRLREETSISTNIWKASTLVLAGALAITTFGGLATAGPQPHMQAALVSLKAAKQQLKDATSDKGGHRARAIDLTDKAIEQVEKGIAHDNEHKGDKRDDGALDMP